MAGEAIEACRPSDWLLGAAIPLRSPKREGGELLAISRHMSGQGISLSFGLHTWCRYFPTYLNCLNKVSYLSGEQDGEMAPPKGSKQQSNQVAKVGGNPVRACMRTFLLHLVFLTFLKKVTSL